MDKINVVCLCDIYNLKEWFGKHFSMDNPWINLMLPEEVISPDSIQHALAFSPGPSTFESYPNLRKRAVIGVIDFPARCSREAVPRTPRLFQRSVNPSTVSSDTCRDSDGLPSPFR